MKICACVVLYNPQKEAIANIRKLMAFTLKVLVLDNSSSTNEVSSNIEKMGGITYVSFGSNKGIGFALKYGAEFAIANKFDYLLTMDQDSVFPFKSKKEIIDELLNNPQYSILALNYNSKNKAEEKISQVNDWITSGSFIKLEDYLQIKGFSEELFIDYVDYDLCEQFVSKGFKIGVINDISIVHQLGDPLTKKILGKTLIYSNHSPERDYYRYRNELYLYKRNRAYFKALHKAEKKNLILILLLEKNRIKKLKMILLGKRHARKGHLGQLSVLK